MGTCVHGGVCRSIALPSGLLTAQKTGLYCMFVCLSATQSIQTYTLFSPPPSPQCDYAAAALLFCLSLLFSFYCVIVVRSTSPTHALSICSLTLYLLVLFCVSPVTDDASTIGLTAALMRSVNRITPLDGSRHLYSCLSVCLSVCLSTLSFSVYHPSMVATQCHTIRSSMSEYYYQSHRSLSLFLQYFFHCLVPLLLLYYLQSNVIQIGKKAAGWVNFFLFFLNLPTCFFFFYSKLDRKNYHHHLFLGCLYLFKRTCGSSFVTGFWIGIIVSRLSSFIPLP